MSKRLNSDKFMKKIFKRYENQKIYEPGSKCYYLDLYLFLIYGNEKTSS